MPDYDVRRLSQTGVTDSQLRSARDLRTQLGSDASVQFSSSGGVAHVFNLGGYLSAEKGGSPSGDLNQFLSRNLNLLGLRQDQLSSFQKVSQERDEITGVTHVYLQQRLQDLQVFGGALKAHVDSSGRVISIEANYYPAAGSYARTEATVSARDALMAALQTTLPDMLAKVAADPNYSQPSGDGNILPAGSAYRFPSVLQAESGTDKLTVFEPGPFSGPIKVHQVLFPTGGGAVLAWEVDVNAPSHEAGYILLIDANTKQLLYRTNLVRHIGTSKASVFTKNPDATPLATKNYFGDPSVSPNGWSGGPATIGNNVQGDSATSLTGPLGDFIYPFTDVWKTTGPNNSGRVAALRSVSDSASVKQVELSPSFVLVQYYGYLRRNPTDPPDSDDSGYQFWLTKLNSFGGDFRAAEMVKAFIASAEYRKRFSLN